MAYLRSLLKIIIAPHAGWYDLAAHLPQQQGMLMRGYFPLTCVAASTALLSRIWDEYPWPLAIQTALIQLAALIVAYYVWLLIWGWLGRWATGQGVDEARASAVGAFTLGVVACVLLIANCMPVDLTLIDFLPMWAVVVVWGSTHFMGVSPTRSTRFVATASAALLVPVYFIIFLFTALLH